MTKFEALQPALVRMITAIRTAQGPFATVVSAPLEAGCNAFCREMGLSRARLDDARFAVATEAVLGDKAPEIAAEDYKIINDFGNFLVRDKPIAGSYEPPKVARGLLDKMVSAVYSAGPYPLRIAEKRHSRAESAYILRSSACGGVIAIHLQIRGQFIMRVTGSVLWEDQFLTHLTNLFGDTGGITAYTPDDVRALIEQSARRTKAVLEYLSGQPEFEHLSAAPDTSE